MTCSLPECLGSDETPAVWVNEAGRVCGAVGGSFARVLSERRNRVAVKGADAPDVAAQLCQVRVWGHLKAPPATLTDRAATTPPPPPKKGKPPRRKPFFNI